MPLKLHSKSYEEIEQAVLYWIELLAEEKYTETYELTFHDPYYQWTPVLLKSVINGYGITNESLEQHHKVTSPLTAIFEEGNQHPYKDISFLDKPLKYQQDLSNITVIGDIHYDLPINGRWSDLTATFKILQGPDFFALELNDIHVL